MKFDSAILLLASAPAVGKLVSQLRQDLLLTFLILSHTFVIVHTAGNTLRGHANSRRFLRE